MCARNILVRSARLNFLLVGVVGCDIGWMVQLFFVCNEEEIRAYFGIMIGCIMLSWNCQCCTLWFFRRPGGGFLLATLLCRVRVPSLLGKDLGA